MSTKKSSVPKPAVSADSIFAPKTPLEMKWWDYHAANPHVLAAFTSVCEDLLAEGKTHEGAKAVAELVRHHRTHQGKPISISNSYISYYARYLAASDERFASFFVFRPTPQKSQTPGFAELLAYAQFAEKNMALIEAEAWRDGEAQLDTAKRSVQALRLHFPEIASDFSEPTNSEMESYRQHIPEITPETAWYLLHNGAILREIYARGNKLRRAALRIAGSPVLTKDDEASELRQEEASELRQEEASELRQEEASELRQEDI